MVSAGSKAPGGDPWHVYPAKLALIAGAYYASAKLGLTLAHETTSVTAIWPPTGIALAALVIWGRAVWPGVALGAFLANMWTGVPLITVLGITCGNTLEAYVGAYLLQRFADFRPALERVRDVLALVTLGAVVSTMLAATVGVLSLVAGDQVQFENFWSVWRVWWLGDMGGDLLMAPLLMIAATHWPFRRAPGRALEAALLAAAVVVVSLFVFQHDTPLSYLMFPLLLWAALRFWQPGAALASLAVATIAVYFTTNGDGPFVSANPDTSLLLAQTYFSVTGVTVLLLATVIAERRRAEEEIEHIAITLQESLLPSVLPEIPGVEVAARFRPAGAAHLVGGDFYDVFDPGDGSWAIVVGDVCGKGSDAAAVTALARYTLRAAASHERSPSRILGYLNDAIRRQRSAREFCTVAYARLELGDAGTPARLTFSTGGHPLPLLLRADGKVEPVGHPGLLVGVVEDAEFAEDTVELEAGDVLLLYTDGLTEAFAPARTLTVPDVASLLESCKGQSAAACADRVHGSVVASGNGVPRDDIALLVVRISE